MNASESVQVIGSSVRGRSAIFAAAIDGTGDGGNLTVVTDRFIIQDGAAVTVSNFSSLGQFPPGSGSPGNINISANSILLDNQGSITAATAVGGQRQYYSPKQRHPTAQQ